VTGATLQSGSAFISEGSPINYNRLTRAISAQELPWAGMTTGSTMSLINVSSTLAALPDIRLRFTDVALLADTTTKSYIFENGGSKIIGNLVFTDCQLRGGYLSLARARYPPDDVGLTNNLLQRVNFSFTQTTKPFPVYLWNNPLPGRNRRAPGRAPTSPALPWAARDNLFDTVTLSANAFPNSYNGYISTTVSSAVGRETTRPSSCGTINPASWARTITPPRAPTCSSWWGPEAAQPPRPVFFITQFGPTRPKRPEPPTSRLATLYRLERAEPPERPRQRICSPIISRIAAETESPTERRVAIRCL